MTYTAAIAAINHPDPIHPYWGLYNARSIEALNRQGVSTNVVVPRPYAPPIGPFSEYSEIPEVSKINGYESHHPRFFYGLPKRLLYGLSGRSYANSVKKYAKNAFDDVDIVHAGHIYPDGYGTISYSNELGVPHVITAHNAGLNKYEAFPRNVRTKIEEALRHCDKLLCVSESLTEKATEIVPDINCEIVPIGADPDRFPTAAECQIRDRWGISTDTPVVFYCGQYLERKGVREITAVLPEVVDTGVHVLFVGQDGPLREDLERTIQEENIADSTDVWYDVSSEVIEKCFAIADLLLLPSHREGRPTVIYEAMASETAVLASEVDGIPEQVADGETGKLIPPGDVNRLRQELIDLCEDRERLQQMGKSGLARLHNRGWTWSGHAESIQQIHEELIG